MGAFCLITTEVGDPAKRGRDKKIRKNKISKNEKRTVSRKEEGAMSVTAYIQCDRWILITGLRLSIWEHSMVMPYNVGFLILVEILKTNAVVHILQNPATWHYILFSAYSVPSAKWRFSTKCNMAGGLTYKVCPFLSILAMLRQFLPIIYVKNVFTFSCELDDFPHFSFFSSKTIHPCVSHPEKSIRTPIRRILRCDPEDPEDLRCDPEKIL